MKIDIPRQSRSSNDEALIREELENDPFKQFERWFKQAQQSDELEPSAMSLATSDNLTISLRTVLLKYFDLQGFVFFTNYDSKKSKAIMANPEVALLFPWLKMERQVKISGRAERVSTKESLKYFASRPKESQLGAWASQQSSHLSSRQILLSQFDKMKNKFKNGVVPLPDFWGGYRVVPHTIEFWQGRDNRLHDRFEYARLEGEEWTISRLAP
jgi:pyridoxamine 5'-phosphate oxidase